jgi:hypothetical protein
MRAHQRQVAVTGVKLHVDDFVDEQFALFVKVLTTLAAHFSFNCSAYSSAQLKTHPPKTLRIDQVAQLLLLSARIKSANSLADYVRNGRDFLLSNAFN